METKPVNHYGIILYRSRKIRIGNQSIGGDEPVMIQSMCSISTMDTEACVEQSIRIFDAGATLVRFTASNIREARNLKLIREELSNRGYHFPICADVHFNPSIAENAAPLVEKVRINPGNFARDDIMGPFGKLLGICRQHKTAIRIGVNHGSLSERILEKYGDSPEGMVESAMEYLRLCQLEQFHDVVVSIKSSNTRIMTYSNRLLEMKMVEENMDYPVHLGVTEAGEGEEGRIRSAAGIGTLLREGIGHTIRVSLTEEPELEIPAARKLLEVAGRESKGLIQKSTGLGSPKTSYQKKKSKKIRNIGGDQVLVVIARFQEESLNKKPPDLEPEYLFVPDHELISDLPEDRKYVLTAESWLLDEFPRETFFPLFSLQDISDYNRTSEVLNFVIITPEETKRAGELLMALKVPICIIYLHNATHESRQAFTRMSEDEQFTLPIVIMASYNESDREKFWIKTAAELAWYFIDGYADGLWLDHPFADNDQLSATAYKILQATRERMTATDYIACPSCGRTLFNIQDTLQEIKAATSHLTHLKIAVMGCIVNGPGEMADADYGYVGSGKGKISLYRNKEIVKKNIPQRNAVEELLHLIKTNGDWHDRS
jgi:(E)-4-hydroxy-3-methylbut-2-enyl-diphosphate synthase